MGENTKRIVHLWSHTGTGLIIKCATGVVYSNQTGGTSCLQPEQEGAFVPVGDDVAIPSRELVSREKELRAYFEGPPWHGSGATSGLTGADADFIDALLKAASCLSRIRVDRNRLRESHEAWVHVFVEQEYEDPALAVVSGFDPWPLEAILTWPNSD